MHTESVNMHTQHGQHQREPVYATRARRLIIILPIALEPKRFYGLAYSTYELEPRSAAKVNGMLTDC